VLRAAGARDGSIALLVASRACLHAALAAGDLADAAAHACAVAATSRLVYAAAPHPRAALDALTAGSAAAEWAGADGGAAAAAMAAAELGHALHMLDATAGTGGGAHGAAARALLAALPNATV
jgi:hypothetical protein